MKRLIFIYGLKYTAVFFLCVCLLICGGDTCPKHENTVFEGWERPIFSPISPEAGGTVEDTLCTETVLEAKTETSPNTEATAPQIPQEPWVTVGEKITAEGEDRCLFQVFVKIPSKTQSLGILLLLKTQPSGEIYAISKGSMPGKMHLSFIIEDNIASVLLDGSLETEIPLSKMDFYVSVGREVENISVDILEILEEN